ncbi:SNARE [Babesia duncani]|uniref:SNARE n=1 Tax=Babesia duncani TaxID=323732 RepID=A0AAD9UNF0_9APIC|nr:SNARE [Babesia duncani]
MYETESSWVLDLEENKLACDNENDDSSICISTRATSINDDGFLSNGLTEKSPLLSKALNYVDGKRHMQNYLKDITKLNDAIDNFSASIQALSLFKYYVQDTKNETSREMLRKRFKKRSIVCSTKIQTVQKQLQKLNHENHYAMVHREELQFSYSDLRTRFNLQDNAVKRLKTLTETYESVIREYTAFIKPGQFTGYSPEPVFEATNYDSESNISSSTILDEISTRSKDILVLEKNAKDLNQLFSDLNLAIMKRGENINCLEQQILLSGEQIERGKEDMQSAYRGASALQSLYLTFVLIAVGTCVLVFPSQLKTSIFGSQ